jgi:hypothetical protein
MAAQAQQIGAELRNAWRRKLHRWWQHYNEEYLGGALRMPLIELSDGEEELGLWEKKQRRLCIAVRHIEADPWLEVMETLRHEMAHQYADEVLRARGETPHGPAFGRACEQLRCSPRARAESAGGRAAGEEDGVLRRLRKVLSLADSPNENEAEAAVKKARRLLLQYNIDAVRLDQERGFARRCLGPIKGRRASYELWLGLILQEFFFVETLWAETYEALKDRRGTILQVYGTKANLDMAEYAHQYLTGLLERLWQEYRKRQALPGNRERLRYWAGVLEGFYDKLREQEEGIRKEGALVWKGDSRLRQYYRYINPRIETRYGQGVRESAAYQDGRREGRRVSIRRPVAAAGGFGGYLKGA